MNSDCVPISSVANGTTNYNLGLEKIISIKALTQQVTAEPSSPEVASGQSHRTWSRKQEDQVLAEAKLALATGDAAPLLRLYDWNGVTSDGRRSITETANALVRRKIDSIVIQPKGLGGNISYIEDGRVYSPNGDVVAHLIFKPNDGSASVDLPLGLKEKNLVVLAYKPSPPISEQQKSPQKWSRQEEQHVLAEVKFALATRDAGTLLRLYDWDGVSSDAQRNSTWAAKELVRRDIESIAVQPKGLGGNIDYMEGGKVYTPNGSVVARLVFKPSDGSAAPDLPLGMKGEKLVILGFRSKTSQ